VQAQYGSNGLVAAPLYQPVSLILLVLVARPRLFLSQVGNVKLPGKVVVAVLLCGGIEIQDAK